jgi:glycosyltransferase involved in cell wall biosynthesis
MNRARVCLTMIVKNEARVIERCLCAALPVIDAWSVVIDDRNSDDTDKIIRRVLKDVPGELHVRPWVNMAHGRTEALELAAETECEYGLVLDADDVLMVPTGYAWPVLTEDRYAIRIKDHANSYVRELVVRLGMGWRYVGVVHEGLTLGPGTHPPDAPILADLTYMRLGGGGAQGRGRAKFLRHAQILEEELRKNPRDTRNKYYLGQSYMDAGNNTDGKPMDAQGLQLLQKALVAFEARAKMKGGWVEETYQAQLYAGLLHEKLRHKPDVIAEALWRAYEIRPCRAEPLHLLAALWREQKNWPKAFLYAAAAMATPRPMNERWLVHDSVYEWKVLDEYATATSHIALMGGEPTKWEDVWRATSRLLQIAPATERKRLQRNLKDCERGIPAHRLEQLKRMEYPVVPGAEGTAA